MSTERRTAELVYDAGATLGEGAFWDPETGRLLWVDIEGRALFVHDPGADKNERYPLPDRPGTVVPRRERGLVVALGRGVAVLDSPGGTLRPLCSFAEEPEANRMNDGKCDPAGRLWVGSISTGTPKGAALYCVETDGSYRTALTGVTISNGIVWTADERTMFYIDTPTRLVQAFDYDRERGTIKNGRTAFVIPEETGYPDGMTIDAEGMVWIAMFGGAAVRRFDPAGGRLLATVELPTANVTSCALGGNDLCDLFITTARIGLSEEARSSQPLAGALFRCRVDVPGVVLPRFGA